MNNLDVFNQRRYLVASSATDISILNLKSPLMAVWWSFTFPGFGHFYIGNFIYGNILLIWEIAVNNFAHVNLSIYYALQGNFRASKAAVNQSWFLSYVIVYAFCMWDSYRRAVELNQQYLLTYGSNRKFPVFNMSSLNIHYLTKKNPWLACVCGAFSPGLEMLYIGKFPAAIFMIGWMILITTKSHWLAAIMYTCWGNFELAKSAIDPQWFLFLPSIYGFVCYEGVSASNAVNGIFKYEQTMFLRENFQDKDFIMPV